MQIPQTSYVQIPAVAFAGMLADSGAHDTISATADVALDAGLIVCAGAVSASASTITSCKLPASAADVTNLALGVSQYLAQRDPQPANAVRFAVSDGVPVIKRGRVWVTCEATIAQEGAVYVVNSGANAGQVRGDANAGAATVLAGAKCKCGVTGAGICMIDINLP